MCILCNDEKNQAYSKYETLTIECNELATCDLSSFSNLSELSFINCEKLTKISALPNKLLSLECNNCNLTQLQELPENLVCLKCSYCPIKLFPPFPQSLIEIYCTRCNAEILPRLPEGLRIFVYDQGPLVKLENLPNSVDYLDISETRICTLPQYHFFSLPYYRFIDYNCPWRGEYRNPDWEKRINDLKMTQKSIRKYLYRRRLFLFSVLKRKTSRDTAGIIFTFLF